MKTVKIYLNEIDTVKKFCQIAYLAEGLKITLHSGKYVVNGKSILGVFSLDLSKPIDCDIEGDEKAIADFIVKLEVEKVLV